MCGIAGIIRWRGTDAEPIEAMTRALQHRGPDGEGILRRGPAALGHRRLSIVDLTDAARQPMPNEEGNLHLVFNGEIYEFRALREELLRRGHRLRSRSDGETILHLFEEKGAEVCDTLEGMYSFAIWDEGRESLLLARDRMGKKPLYYALLSGGIAFASELKALLLHPEISREVDPEALRSYLLLGYVPGASSIFSSVRRLPPGTCAIFDREGFRSKKFFSPRVERDAWRKEAGEYEDELKNLLAGAVEKRLIADVEVGVFLSGGIDSSLLTLLTTQGQERTRTFSMGFDDPRFNESPFAEKVSSTLKTDHVTVRLGANTMLEAIPEVIRVFDEPFADVSAIPTFLLAKTASRYVKSVIGGDGADELFGGYPTLRAQRWAECLSFLSPSAPAVAKLMAPLHDGSGYYPLSFVARRFLEGWREKPGARQVVWTSYLSPRRLFSLTGTQGFPGPVAEALEGIDHRNAEETSLELDQRMYLPDDILVKADRASMANSLEVRSPFLDRDVTDFANRLPRELVRDKILLRRLLRQSPLQFISSRKKTGFTVPAADWLRGPLREWSRERIKAVSQLGLDGAAAVAIWGEHQEGRRNLWREVWTLAVLGAWADEWS